LEGQVVPIVNGHAFLADKVVLITGAGSAIGIGRAMSLAFARAGARVAANDITSDDLEMPLSDLGHPKEKLIAFHASPDIAPDLKQAGFDVLALANNHSMDYGHEALLDTIVTLDRLGIRHVGAGKSLAEAVAAEIVEVKGRRIGFVAFSSLLPLGASAGELRPGMAPIHVHVAYEVNPYYEMEEPGNPPRVKTWADAGDLAAFEDVIRELRSQVDFLAVSAHWGFGAGEELAEYQRPLGQALIDAGAEVVIGNHVHAIHGIEVYNGKVILYSPGNFIAQQPREGLSAFALSVLDGMSTDGYAAWLDVAGDGRYTVRITPTVTDEQGLPVIARGEAFDRIAERLARLSAELGTIVRV
jgi:poly-gamma-glutamate capsule biosynthesis protein CapA/YwtB (metallophosphatase superfamily)